MRAAGGRREFYQPLVCRLSRTSQPLDVAGALSDALGLTAFYLADLDALAGCEPAWEVYRDLQRKGNQLWVDAGVVRLEQARALADVGVETVVVGLETVAGPEELANINGALATRVVFSLDLRGGQPLVSGRGWDGPDARAVSEQAVGLGTRRLLILDLARVGSGAGTGTEALCAWLAHAHPEVEVGAGGGIRGLEDLRALEKSGVRTALVGTALYGGALGRAELERLGGT